MADAAVAALDNAGLAFDDIDGLLTTPSRVDGWPMPCTVVAGALGALVYVIGSRLLGMRELGYLVRSLRR